MDSDHVESMDVSSLKLWITVLGPCNLHFWTSSTCTLQDEIVERQEAGKGILWRK